MSSITHISHDNLQQIITQLDQSLYNHQQWYNALIRTLICHLPVDKHDLATDAHTECRFGQWYYSQSPSEITDHPGFKAIGTAHITMHQQASRLLQESMSKPAISPMDYDHFANSLEQLRLEIYSLKNELEAQLYNQDALTSAINRNNMPYILREQQEMSKRQKQDCCLVLMDIDFFKKFNDTYGHLAGDLVLSTVANYIIENLRSIDKLFRYGGEEFLICLPFTPLSEANTIMDRLRQGIADLKIQIKPNEYVNTSVSMGLAVLGVDYPVEASIARADKALYEAKSSGRNCVRTFTEQAPGQA